MCFWTIVEFLAFVEARDIGLASFSVGVVAFPDDVWQRWQ